MTSFLLDANLSPLTERFLSEQQGLDVVSLARDELGLTDPQVAALARSRGRVVITFDLDFGELYHLLHRGEFGVIILRLDDQTVESVNRVLSRFFTSDLTDLDLEHSLIVLEEDRARIVRGGQGRG